MIKRYVEAYSLVELVVVLTILSIVSMMTMPNYDGWIKRFRYWEIIQEIHPIKLQVEWCYWQKGDLAECNNNVMHQRSTADSTSLIDTIEVEEGVIHVIPRAVKGLSRDDDFTLKPLIRSHRLVWHYHGAAVRKGYVRHG